MNNLILTTLAIAILSCFASPAEAVLTLTTSETVLLIDGVGDGDADVTIGISDTSSGLDFGYVSSGIFTTILPDASPFTTYTALGGSILDFAIYDVGTSSIVAQLSDGSATMDFTGDKLASYSQYPVVTYDYWQNLTITWLVGGNDIVFNVGGENDGFAPATYLNSGNGVQVPEPSTLTLLGVGLLGFGLMRRKHVA